MLCNNSCKAASLLANVAAIRASPQKGQWLMVRPAGGVHSALHLEQFTFYLFVLVLVEKSDFEKPF
jgi:hypothetical protein